MGDEGWQTYLRDGCIGDNCWAAVVGYTESGDMFEAVATDDNGWAHFYAEPHEETVNEQKVTINETANLMELITTNKVETGLWLGGTKYQVVRADQMPFKDDTTYPVFIFASGKKGGCIVVGPTYYVIGLYDEEQNHTKNGCLGVIMEFCHAVKDS